MTGSPQSGAEGLLVVARRADGEVLRGTTHDFNPARSSFHLSVRGEQGARTMEIVLASLKAVFFVRTFGGDSKRVANYDFDATPGQGRRVVVTFKDGESIAGYVIGYTPGRSGFFLIPADSGDNNARIFVVNAAVGALKWGSGER